MDAMKVHTKYTISMRSKVILFSRFFWKNLYKTLFWLVGPKNIDMVGFSNSFTTSVSSRPSERGNFSHLLLSFSLERQEVPFPIGFLPFYVSPPPFPRLIASASMTASCSLTVLLTFSPNLCYPDGKEIKEVGNTIVLGSVPNMHTWYPDLDKKNLH